MNSLRFWRVTLLVIGILLTGCNSAATATPSVPQDLQVSPQNSAFLIGYNRLGIGLTDAANKAVLGATHVSVDIPNGSSVKNWPLAAIGHEYSDIPVYIGVVSFPAQGSLVLTVHATYKNGSAHEGIAHIKVTNKSAQLPIGYQVPLVKQRILADVAGKVSDIDSGVPPDAWHTETIAEGVAQHKPMVLYFGQPGHCVSRMCGPTVQLLQELKKTADGSKFLFEHIEVNDPADSGALSPAYVAFGFNTEPWVYFINAHGIVADRYEGPVSLQQLEQSAAGTLAGHVPAVILAA